MHQVQQKDLLLISINTLFSSNYHTVNIQTFVVNFKKFCKPSYRKFTK